MSADLDLDDVAAQSPAAVAELAALRARLAALEKALEDVAYSGRTKTGMKEQAKAALFAAPPA